MSTTKRLLTAAAAAFLLVACDELRIDGPTDPEPFAPPRLVAVTLEYRQPQECVAGSPAEFCEDDVLFFSSWMRTGQYIRLVREPGRFIWRGTATGVPVNFPPRDQPHAVVVYDPHMAGAPTGGVSAERLKVGGELITRFDSPGGPRESGLIYIDQNGQGHSPF